MDYTKRLEDIVKNVDHLKTPENPEGNPFFPNNLSDNEAVTKLTNSSATW